MLILENVKSQKATIEKAWSYIPEKWKQVPFTVAIIPEKKWTNGDWQGATSVGGANGVVTSVRCEFLSKWVTVNHVMHELCHGVVGQLSREKWERWLAVFPSIKNQAPSGEGKAPHEVLPECLVKYFNPRAKGYKPLTPAVKAAVEEVIS